MKPLINHSQFLTAAVNKKGYPPEGPPEIAFAGRSNVGKSSLINALTGRRKLARVSSRPGRTQEINFFDLNQGEMRLVDLPGYGFAKVPMSVRMSWRKLVEDYLTSRESLAAVVVIVDIRREPTPEDLMLLEFLAAHGRRALLAVTKADKLSRNQQISRMAKLRPLLAAYDSQPVVFSATTRLGKEALEDRLREMLATFDFQPPSPDPV